MVAGPGYPRPRAGSGDRRGFTLAETMVALTISSVVVVLVSTVFLVQNRYYAVQVQRSGAQDVVRAVTELVSAEVRSTAAGGIVAAQSDSLTVRSPMVIGGICYASGSHAVAHFAGGAEAMDLGEIAGIAVHDTLTGTWSFYNEDWPDLYDSLQPTSCHGNGSDTVGAYDNFVRIKNLTTLHGSIPASGNLLMLFRETTFAFRDSQLDPGARALYRGSRGDTLVEYATGMDATAQFQYRLSGSASFVDAVSSGNLDDIDAVRIVARARQRSEAGGLEDVVFGWSVNIPVRNVR